MNRSRRVALAALCVLALALGAATLDDTTAPPGGGGTPAAGSDADFESTPSLPLINSSSDGPSAGLGSISYGLCIPFLTTSTFYALAFIVLLLLGAVLYRKGGLALSVAGIGVLLPPGFVIWAVLTVCNFGAPEMGSSGGAANESGSGGLFGGSTGGVLPTSGTPDVSHAILAIAALVVLFIALFMIRATDDDRTAESVESVEAVPPEQLAGLASVAGEAADRIESSDGDTENEVYRAWREMTDLLDVPSPRSATPAEFRAAAQEAGMAERHVDALTDLFREVRYGGATVTPERETAAVEALRAIEETYSTRNEDASERRGNDDES